MKVLITGGAGFIGSHLTERLLSRGDTVWVIDNFATGRRDNLTPHKHLNLIEDTIHNEKFMFDIMHTLKPDVVVHAAASYKDPNEWIEDTKTNVIGTEIICKSMQVAGVKRIIYFQTALCYGLKPLEQPITLNHPLSPGGSSYAISKTAGEYYIQLSGLDFVTFRLANAYGPRNISGPLPTFFKRLTNKQPCFVMDTRRDFVYIDDMINCILPAIDGKGHGAYHISSGSDISIKSLFDATTKALGLEVLVEVKPRQKDDVFSILLDPSRTNLEFGWSATMPLNEGVQKTIEYYQTYGIKETFTHLKETHH